MKYIIPNTKHYVSEMAKPIKEKLWFLDHVWVRKMVDIGTADAFIPRYMYEMFDHPFSALCYEPNTNLYWEARRAVREIDSIEVFENFTKFFNRVNGSYTDLCLLSSVLHEVYDKNIHEDKLELFNVIRASNAQYVAIRDMHLPNANVSTPKHISEAILKYVNNNPEQANRFNEYNKVNPISNASNAIQYLLKYRYNINWSHEINENYFSIDFQEVTNILELYGYKIIVADYFTPKFILSDIKSTFDIDLSPTTHVKLLFEKIL